MAYKPFKMKGHELPGPNQRKSPAKHERDAWGFKHGHKYHRSEDAPGTPPNRKSPAKHEIDAWGFKHGHKYHRSEDASGTPPNEKSPTKQATISTVADSLTNLKNPALEKLIAEFEEKSKAIQDSTHKANQEVLEKRAEQIQQNVSPKEFKKQIEEFKNKTSPTKQIGPRNEKGEFVQIHNLDAAEPGPEITTTVTGRLPEGVYIGKDGELKNKQGFNYRLTNEQVKSFKNLYKRTKELAKEKKK